MKIQIKALIIFAGMVAAGAGIFFAMNSGPPKSPPATAAYRQGNLDVQVAYSSPSKRNRLIFGEKSENALVPFDKYWRLGANAATEITFAKNATFAGKPIAAGSYRMYAMPGKTTWKVILNSQLKKWGAFEPNHDKDVLTVEVPSEQTADKKEQFTISFAPDGAGAKMDFSWDGTLVRIPLAAAN